MSMVEITRIVQTKRGRYALFCGEEFLFSIDEETLADHEVYEGSSIGDGELSLIRAASETHKAKEQALRYLSLRAYGQKELYRKLCQKYDELSAAAVVAALCEIGLLDDAAFAAEKAKGLFLRGKSSGEVHRQLGALGIDDEIARQAIAAAEPNDNEAALKIVQKNYIEKLRDGKRQQVMAALARRGFSHAVICWAVQQAEREMALCDDARWEE